jgi:excisionase family DNA binding protein
MSTKRSSLEKQFFDPGQRLQQRAVLDVRAISVEDGARAIGIGRTALYELINSGQIATLRIGRRRLIPIVEIDKFLECRTERRTLAR